MSERAPLETFEGPACLPGFRQEKLENELRAKVPSLLRVVGDYVHLVHVRGKLSSADRTVLRALLEYGEQAPRTAAPGPEDRVAWVMPRLGTISPWASKATDIAHVCGLKAAGAKDTR